MSARTKVIVVVGVLMVTLVGYILTSPQVGNAVGAVASAVWGS